MSEARSVNPWDWMQPYDVRRFGDIIMNTEEQTRWCRAVMLGGLPYMWKLKAEPIRRMIYERLALRAGDKVLLIGECIEPCGFVDDVRERIGAMGEIRVIDITDEARDAYFSGKRGSGGQLATWRFNYTSDMPEAYFDCVACLQGVQHTDDWRETGKELLRIMKRGRSLVLAEIAYSPETRMKIELDMHIQYMFEKLCARVGFRLEDFPYYSPEALLKAFAGLVKDPGVFAWKGIEMFWGTKP